MIVTPSLIYWANIADSVSCSLIILLLLEALWVIVLSVVNLNRWSELKETKWKFLKLNSIIFTIILLVITFIPSTKTIYQMYIIPTIVNSPIAQKLPDELQQFIDKELSITGDKK